MFNYSTAVIPEFAGTLDGNGFTIGNQTIVGGAHLGLIGTIQYAGEIKNLGVVDANVVGNCDIWWILEGQDYPRKVVGNV